VHYLYYVCCAYYTIIILYYTIIILYYTIIIPYYTIFCILCYAITPTNHLPLQTTALPSTETPASCSLCLKGYQVHYEYDLSYYIILYHTYIILYQTRYTAILPALLFCCSFHTIMSFPAYLFLTPVFYHVFHYS
jgi:hypothetical protein